MIRSCKQPVPLHGSRNSGSFRQSYHVYMMASANKFLRIYYATVKAYLESLELTA